MTKKIRTNKRITIIKNKKGVRSNIPLTPFCHFINYLLDLAASIFIFVPLI
jgi:hypothetical protein